MSTGIASSFGASAAVTSEKVFTSLVNDAAATDNAVAAARSVAGHDKVDTDYTPLMASEDFSYMLERVPGCYILLGTGRDLADPMLHNPHYDFNDDALMIGVGYWAELVRRQLPAT